MSCPIEMTPFAFWALILLWKAHVFHLVSKYSHFSSDMNSWINAIIAHGWSLWLFVYSVPWPELCWLSLFQRFLVCPIYIYATLTVETSKYTAPHLGRTMSQGRNISDTLICSVVVSSLHKEVTNERIWGRNLSVVFNAFSSASATSEGSPTKWICLAYCVQHVLL